MEVNPGRPRAPMLVRRTPARADWDRRPRSSLRPYLDHMCRAYRLHPRIPTFATRMVRAKISTRPDSPDYLWCNSFIENLLTSYLVLRHSGHPGGPSDNVPGRGDGVFMNKRSNQLEMLAEGVFRSPATRVTTHGPFCGRIYSAGRYGRREGSRGGARPRSQSARDPPEARVGLAGC